MPTCFDVAHFYLSKAKPDDGDFMTNMRLQKLAYYAQGLSLAILGCPLFEEEFEAWDLGPVIPELWKTYRHFGALPIPQESEEVARSRFSLEQLQVLNLVYQEYGQYSGWKLSKMTHSEPPWLTTPKNNRIDKDTLKAFFSEVVAGLRERGAEEAERRLESDAKRVPFEEVWAHVARRI